MNVEEYENEAHKTVRKDKDDFFLMGNWIAGLAGETGELLELAREIFHSNENYGEEKFVKELGDVLWYCAATARTQGLRLSKVMDFAEFSEFQNYVTDDEPVTRELYVGTYPNIFRLAVRLSVNAGKLCDYLKKVIYHEHPVVPIKVSHGLDDCLVPLALIATDLHLKLDAVAEANIAKLRARYGKSGEFSVEKSMNRKPGDV